MSQLSTVQTSRHLALVGNTSVVHAFEVLLSIRRPAVPEVTTRRLGAKKESNHKLTIEHSLEIDKAHDIVNFSLHSNGVDVEVVFTHFSLDISPSGVGNCLGVNFQCLAEIIKVPFIAGFLHCRPTFVGKHISNAVEVKLSVLLAFHGLVAFSLAVLADIRGSLGAINSRVTFLLADTAGTLEHTGLRAFRLGMAFFAAVEARAHLAGLGAIHLGVTLLATVEARTGLARLGTLGLAVAFLAAVVARAITVISSTIGIASIAVSLAQRNRVIWTLATHVARFTTLSAGEIIVPGSMDIGLHFGHQRGFRCAIDAKVV